MGVILLPTLYEDFRNQVGIPYSLASIFLR
jgi:hypothetical protein